MVYVESMSVYIPDLAAKALGIRFYCVGASESCSAYRDVIVANSGKKVTGGKGHIEHLYDSLEKHAAREDVCLAPGPGAGVRQVRLFPETWGG